MLGVLLISGICWVLWFALSQSGNYNKYNKMAKAQTLGTLFSGVAFAIGGI